MVFGSTARGVARVRWAEPGPQPQARNILQPEQATVFPLAVAIGLPCLFPCEIPYVCSPASPSSSPPPRSCERRTTRLASCVSQPPTTKPSPSPTAANSTRSPPTVARHGASPMRPATRFFHVILAMAPSLLSPPNTTATPRSTSCPLAAAARSASRPPPRSTATTWPIAWGPTTSSSAGATPRPRSCFAPAGIHLILSSGNFTQSVSRAMCPRSCPFPAAASSPIHPTTPKSPTTASSANSARGNNTAAAWPTTSGSSISNPAPSKTSPIIPPKTCSPCGPATAKSTSSQNAPRAPTFSATTSPRNRPSSSRSSPTST